MSGRSGVPKNICVYAFAFLVLFFAWTGILLLYYHHWEPGGSPGEGTALLDFGLEESLGVWFLTAVWSAISFFSFIMVRVVWDRKRLHSAVGIVPEEIGGATIPKFGKYHGFRRIFFWLFCGAVALMMSADTVCGFIPYFFRRLVDAVRAGAGEDGDISTFAICLLGGAILISGVIAAAIRDYTRGLSFSRLYAFAAFGPTLFLLGMSLLFGLTVPETALNRPSAPRKPAAAEAAPSETTPKTDQAPSEPYLPESNYRTISRQKGADKNVFTKADLSDDVTFEKIFGMNVSLEEKLNLDRTIEETLHLKRSIESYLFAFLPKLSLPQAQTFLRRGFYGYFLAMLVWSLGLLARIEQVEYEDLVAEQTDYRAAVGTGPTPTRTLENILKLRRKHRSFI